MANDRKIDKIEKLGKKGKAKKLLPYAESGEADLRAAAASALGEAGGEDAYHNLISMLRDDDDNVRICAVKSLKKLGKESAVEHIRHSCSRSENPIYQDVCRDALASLRTNQY